MNKRPAILGGQPVFPEFLPMVRPALPKYSEIASRVEEIMETGMLTKGHYLDQLEKAVAKHLDVKHAVGVSSCTVGLLLTYLGLNLTGEVIIPSFTFMATASSIVLAGLRPVFADIDPRTMNIDPVSVEAEITPETSAIVAVHNFGNPAKIKTLENLAAKRGLKLIFDAAHGFGSTYLGNAVGPQGDAHVFSLSPTKLVTGGEGGIVATEDDELAEKIRTGREYGHKLGYDSEFAGINGRMGEFNAILALHSLKMLDEAVQRRNIIAGIFKENLSCLPGIGFQEIDSGNRSSYKDFSIIIDSNSFGLSRNELALALKAENIDSRPYYDPPVHEQTAYRKFYDGNLLPNTCRLSKNSLSLPIWSHMDDEIALKICHAVKRIFDSAKEIRAHRVYK